MYLVRYRCQYREQWYDDLETDNYQEAVERAMALVTGGRLAVVVMEGSVVWHP
jgi:hypothetical protein